MVTLIGDERDLLEMLDNLLQLALDARESYDVALPGVDVDALRTMLKSFKADHQKQADALAALLTSRGRPPSAAPDDPQVAGLSAVAANDVTGDETILSTLARCEADAMAAYERGLRFAGGDEHAHRLLQAGLDCLRRHQDSISELLKPSLPPDDLPSQPPPELGPGPRSRPRGRSAP